jgi:hypothetical protein
MSVGMRQCTCHRADCVARCAISLSVIGSVRDRDMPEPNEYSVSGVRAYKGRGPGENAGGEYRPGFAIDSQRLCFMLGVLGDAICII